MFLLVFGSFLAILHSVNGFDECDVRGRFMNERGEYNFNITMYAIICKRKSMVDSLGQKSLAKSNWFSECRNKAGDEKCDKWAALGYCHGQEFESMRIQCKKSCLFCSKFDLISHWRCFECKMFYMRSIFCISMIYITFLVCPDLYQEFDKTTCLPEKNDRYEDRISAKFACARDATCSGLVEAPKRRGQNKIFGEYSYTEREVMLCSYPVQTKSTDDTIFFRKRGKLIKI